MGDRHYPMRITPIGKIGGGKDAPHKVPARDALFQGPMGIVCCEVYSKKASAYVCDRDRLLLNVHSTKANHFAAPVNISGKPADFIPACVNVCKDIVLVTVVRRNSVTVFVLNKHSPSDLSIAKEVHGLCRPMFICSVQSHIVVADMHAPGCMLCIS